MRSAWLAICAVVACAAMIGWALPAAAQSPATGALEFEAQVTPSGTGQAEPARQMFFYLLRKDLSDIRKEAEQNRPAPDLDHFIDSLEVSASLKAWMKKNHTAEFTGTSFTKGLKPADIMDIPEFLEAYKNLNGSILSTVLPTSQMKESDRLKNPQKYQKAKEKYDLALRQYIVSNPQSTDGMDAELTDKHYDRGWMQEQVDQQRGAEERAMMLAQTHYLAAKTMSDLNGRGFVGGLTPGTYWITTLNIPALAGDTRLQWDVPVLIQAGQTTRLSLDNFNALPRPERMAH